MTLKRFPDWQKRLAAQIEKARASKFQWGTFDCALSAADAIAAISGLDPAAAYRGKYKTEAEAGAIMGTDLGAFAARIAASIGAKEVRPTFARRGDVVLVDNTRAALSSQLSALSKAALSSQLSALGKDNDKDNAVSTALGFVDLSGGYALCATDHGLVRVPMRRWLKGWQIG